MKRFLGVADILLSNERYAWHARFGSFTMVLEAGAGEAVAITVAGGAVTAREGPAATADIRLVASRESWDLYLSAEPPPGYQNIMTMFSIGVLDIEGDPILLYRYLFLIEGLASSVRENLNPVVAENSGASARAPSIDSVVGRYLRLDIDGREHSVYFEEAGEGIPLLCLHTAGADTRQYRALLRDPEITSKFRVIAFDLPWHGKSSPPAGYESELYMLSTDRYMDIVLAVKRALQLDRPAVMGCSIGGRAVLHIALRHGDEFRGAIGLQSAMYAEQRELPGAPGVEHFYRPDLHGSEVAAAGVGAMMAPRSPTADMWETKWHYMQGGPGVFMGDLYFYFSDGDLRNGGLRGLDRRKCPIYLLTGEYDLSATPEMTAELAHAVEAEHFEIMRGLGHFPMSENPPLFRTFLMPVLEKIAARDEGAGPGRPGAGN